MSDPKDFVAVVDSDARKTPRRIAFITKRSSPQVHVKDEDRVMTWFLFELVVLTAIGTFFRGPGWSWVLPWRA